MKIELQCNSRDQVVIDIQRTMARANGNMVTYIGQHSKEISDIFVSLVRKKPNQK